MGGWLMKYCQSGGLPGVMDMLGAVTADSDSPANLFIGLLDSYMKHRNPAPVQNNFTQQEQAYQQPNAIQENSALSTFYLPETAYPDFAPIETSAPVNDKTNTVPISIGQVISKKESGGNYHATNPHSSATGKYQFLWNTWKDSIRNITGVQSRQDFLNNPQAQENYFKWYSATILSPAVNRIKHYNNRGYTDTQLAQLVHFKGEKGAREWLASGTDKTQAHNTPIDKYLKGQSGIAVTEQQQHIGLNDPVFDELFFPMQGTNTFRGLDNNQPVLLTDRTGKTKMLVGPQDTSNMTGPVHEQRINAWLSKYK